MTSNMIVRPESVCGAWVEGIDLSTTLPEAQFERLKRELHAHGVLFFRDQEMTPEQHVMLGRRFGKTYVSPYDSYAFPEFPDIMVVNEKSKGVVQWHSDTTFEPIPPFGTILQAKELPSSGGDTLWANMVAAYEALSPAMQEFLLGKHAVHDFASEYATERYAHRKELIEGKELRCATHPVVCTDEVTGKRSLFVNELYVTRIVELSKEESDALLPFLFSHIKRPEFQTRLRWEVNTVAMWSNMLTMHYPVADYTEPRRMNRVCIQLDKPPA